MDWLGIIRDFVTLFVVIDPVGSLPVYLFAVAHVPAALHRQFAIRAVGIAGLVLLAFLFGGQYLLEAIGLRLGSFQIAGGIILFLFALTMIFGDAKSTTEIAEAERDHDHLAGAVFPLAMPSIASPGAMLAIVVLTENEKHSVADQIMTAGLLGVVLAITLVLLLTASFVQRVIGTTGTSVISRVMGIILATIAVDSVLVGLDTLQLLDLDAAFEANPTGAVLAPPTR